MRKGINRLTRFVLIWGGYAVSAFAGNAASYAGIWYVTESTGSPLALAALYVLAFLPMGLLTAMNGLTIPVGTALGGVIAQATGTAAFFSIDGLFIIALGIGIALPKSVRSLE